MSVEEIIKKRRSVRVFDKRPVDKSMLEKLVEAAVFAPSACNIQGWKFIIIDKQELKEKIFNLGGSVLIKSAPTAILVLYDNRTTNTEYHDHIQSASAAIQNIHLAAVELGLGTCWICHLPSQSELKKLFDIPTYFSPIAYVLVGYPKNNPTPVPRKYELAEIMGYNRFSPHWPIEKINRSSLLIKRVMIKIYRLTPNILKKSFLNKYLDKKHVKKFDN